MEKIRNNIFEIEAKSLLQDLMLNTVLNQYHKNINIRKINKAIAYIQNIFKEYHNLKKLHMLVNYNNDILYGYSMSFIHNEINALYLHKIHVNEQYRNRGIGTAILNALEDENCNIALLCLKKKESFYIKNKFHYVESFNIAKYKSYNLSKSIYLDLSLMTNSKEGNNIPIFLLKDSDINNIANILK